MKTLSSRTELQKLLRTGATAAVIGIAAMTSLRDKTYAEEPRSTLLEIAKLNKAVQVMDFVPHNQYEIAMFEDHYKFYSTSTSNTNPITGVITGLVVRWGPNKTDVSYNLQVMYSDINSATRFQVGRIDKEKDKVRHECELYIDNNITHQNSEYASVTNGTLAKN